MKKMKKLLTNFEAVDDGDVINRAYLDEKILKLEVNASFIEKDYNEFKLQYNKQPVEGVLIQRAVKTTMHILYDEGFLIPFPMQIMFKKFFCLLQDVELI